MLLHYFLTSLPPVDIASVPPLSSSDFLQRARACLHDDAMGDLERLYKIKTINRATTGIHVPADLIDLHFDETNEKNVSPMHARYLFWLWLNETCHSSLVKNIARDMAKFHHTLALVLAKHYTSTDFTSSAGLPHWLREKLNFDDGDFANNTLLANISDQNPREFEMAVDKRIVDIVENHSRGDDEFLFDHVVIYFIKLLLAERHASFTHEAGHKILEKIIEGCLHERA